MLFQQNVRLCQQTVLLFQRDVPLCQQEIAYRYANARAGLIAIPYCCANIKAAPDFGDCIAVPTLQPNVDHHLVRLPDLRIGDFADALQLLQG